MRSTPVANGCGPVAPVESAWERFFVVREGTLALTFHRENTVRFATRHDTGFETPWKVERARRQRHLSATATVSMNFARLVAQVSFLHPPHGEQVYEGS